MNVAQWIALTLFSNVLIAIAGFYYMQKMYNYGYEDGLSDADLDTK